MSGEGFFQGIQWAGADIAIDDANGAQQQGRKLGLRLMTAHGICQILVG